jgi:hypothetical protein
MPPREQRAWLPMWNVADRFRIFVSVRHYSARKRRRGRGPRANLMECHEISADLEEWVKFP